MTVGIVGLGSIGQAVASLAGAFGCRVIATRRRVGAGESASGADGSAITRVTGPEGLTELLAESDFVVLAAPLTPETEGMIDERALAAVKPGAWLINIARGRLVDERALLRALRDGPLGGAVLDTFRDEPLPPGSPFYDLPNVIVTPHTSWSSGRVLDRIGRAVLRQPPALFRRRAAAQRRRPDRRLLGPGAGPPTVEAAVGHNRGMQIAIVGLAGSGKTTVFNTLTRGHAETGGFGGLQLNVGVVKVPDERLDRLAAIFKPKKIVQADVTYVDLPAPPASSEGHVGTEELPAEHLARLRESDALLHVVRAFDDPAMPHPEGSVDPWRDIERLDLEFILADLAMAERRLERLKTSARHGSQASATRTSARRRSSSLSTTASPRADRSATPIWRRTRRRRSGASGS